MGSSKNDKASAKSPLAGGACLWLGLLMAQARVVHNGIIHNWGGGHHGGKGMLRGRVREA